MNKGLCTGCPLSAFSSTSVLPQDEWVHLWTGEEYHGGAITVSAELGYTPAFYISHQN